MKEIYDKLVMILSVFFGIPFGVFVTSYLDINNWLVLALPFILATIFYFVIQFILKKKTTWANNFFYTLLSFVLALTLNRYIKIGESFTVSCLIENANYQHIKHNGIYDLPVDDKSYTYHFSKNEFSHAWLLRTYNAAMGDFGDHGTMQMTFRRGLFGISVLTATKWIDDDDSAYYERTDE